MSFPSDIGLFHLERTHRMRDYEDSMAYMYVHSKHKCSFLFIHNPRDSHNVTNILVKTPTTDNSGINHIVEHLVCCRSEKYGSGKAWDQLTSASFNTGMEAYTCSCHTGFTFSTVNLASFKQAIPVVLDMVFHSDFNEADFLKEGHRFEEDEGELKHNGVVYNEVVADMYETWNYLATEKARILFDKCVGQFNMSGDEEMIEKVTLDDVKRVYKKYYRPSNSIFCHYGNFDPNIVIGAVAQVVDVMEYVETVIDRGIYEQPRWTEPRMVRMHAQAPNETKPMDEQYIVMIAWYICPGWEWEIREDMKFIVKQLMNLNTSPFYEALIATRLAESLADSGIDTTSVCCFTITVDGVKRENVDKVVDVVHETLQKVVDNGLAKDRKQSAINAYSLYLMTPTWSEGSDIFEAISHEMSLDCDPFPMLDAVKGAERIREKDRLNDRYWEEMIKKYLIDNQHRLTVIVEPQEDFVVNQNNKITERLKEKFESMTKEELANLARQKALIEDETEADDSKLPIPEFSRNDLSRDFPMTKPVLIEDNVALNIVPSKKYCYVGLEAQFHLLAEDLEMLNLILPMWEDIGAGSRDEKEFLLFAQTYGDGFSFDIEEIETVVGQEEDFPIIVHITVGFLEEFSNQIMEIFRDVVLSPHFDSPKVAEIELPLHLGNLMESVADIENVARYCQLGFSKITNYSYVMGGYGKIKTLQKAVSDGDWAKLCKDMQAFYNRIMKCARFKAFVNCSSHKAAEGILPQMKDLVRTLNANGAEIQAPVPQPYVVTIPENVYLSHSVTTSSVAVAIYTKPMPDEKSVVFHIVAQALNSLLYDALRDGIGVYAFQAEYKEFECVFLISTECDPKPDESLAAIREGLEEIAAGQLTEEAVSHAVVAKFSEMDTPFPAHLKGIDPFSPRSIMPRDATSCMTLLKNRWWRLSSISLTANGMS